MNKLHASILAMVCFGLFASGCSDNMKTPVGSPPTDKIVTALEFSRYAAIKAQGGMKVQVTATGKQLTLHPTLHSVRVEKCTKHPQTKANEYECQLTISLSLKEGGKPSSQGERISVTQGADGVWRTP